MRKLAAVLLSLLVVSLFPISVSAAAPQSNPESYLLVGTAACPITPPAEQINGEFYLGGYGFGKERGPALGVRDEIWSRAIALSDGSLTVVLVVLDLPGISCSDLDFIRREAGESAGIPWENILVSVTHTHAGPDMQGLWGGVPDAYRDYLRSQAVDSVVAAAGKMQPGKIRVASTEYTAGVKNRRKSALTDPYLSILHAASLNGDTIASLVVYGVHSTFLDATNRLISADFCGWVVECLEEELGGSALFMAGVQGDQSLNKRGLELEEYARELVDTALDALKKEPLEITGASLELRRADIALEIRNPVFVMASALGYLRGYNICFSPVRGLFIPSEVNYLRVGEELSFITVPGEALAKLGLEAKESSDTAQTIFLGLTCGSLGYLLHEDEWRGGVPFVNSGYEESVSLGRHAGPVVLESLREIITPAR